MKRVQLLHWSHLLVLMALTTSCADNALNASRNAPALSKAILAVPKAPPVKEEVRFTALLRDAVIEIENNCVRVRPFGETESYLAIFPYGYSLAARSQQHVVLDANKDVFAEIGVTRNIGGGEFDEIRLDNFVAGVKDCAGPYWLVSP